MHKTSGKYGIVKRDQTYESEHTVLGFLFLGQFAENDGFQIHPSPYKGHELIIFYGCIVFHSIYVQSIINGHLG